MRKRSARQRADIYVSVRCLLLLTSAVVFAAGGPPDITGARRLYLEAVEGNDTALKDAVKVLSELTARDPHDPVIQAYLGSSRLLESSKTAMPWKKGKLAKEGLERLDGAVRSAPDDPEIRFLRAASTFHLPGWFGRAAESEADLRRLAEPDVTSRLNPRLAAAAMYYHGILREKAGDKAAARAAWAEAARLSPLTRAGREAASKLAGR